MKHTLYIFIAFVAAQLTATAQKDLVLFDTKDYEAVGVYDAWENSPFRDGRLEGKAAAIIADNMMVVIEEDEDEVEVTYVDLTAAFISAA